MGVSEVFARGVALVGGAMIMLRRQGTDAAAQAIGAAPAIPAGKAQGIPTLKMPTARGWPAGQRPTPAPGLKVNAFATGLKHPRWIYVLPNGDVLAAQSLTLAGPVKTPFDYAIVTTMRRAAALGPSPNRISAPARRRRRRHRRDARGVPRQAQPAVRHGAARRHLLRRQYRRAHGIPLCRRRHPHHRARAAGDRLQAGRPLDAQHPAEPGRQQALRRGRLAEQYRRIRHGGRGRPRRGLRDRRRERREAHLRLRAAQPGGAGLGARQRHALDRGQRARRFRRRDAARLSDLGPGRRLLRLAL